MSVETPIRVLCELPEGVEAPEDRVFRTWDYGIWTSELEITADGQLRARHRDHLNAPFGEWKVDEDAHEDISFHWQTPGHYDRPTLIARFTDGKLSRIRVEDPDPAPEAASPSM